MALVLTKADLLPDAGAAAVDTLAQDRLGMTLHAGSSCTRRRTASWRSAASVQGPIWPDGAADVFQPRPFGLAAPLLWLSDSLRQQDEARLEHVWQLQPNHFALLRRCVRCFVRRTRVQQRAGNSCSGCGNSSRKSNSAAGSWPVRRPRWHCS